MKNFSTIFFIFDLDLRLYMYFHMLSRRFLYKTVFQVSSYNCNFISISSSSSISPQLTRFPLSAPLHRYIHTSLTLRNIEHPHSNKSIKVTFVDRDGDHVTVEGNVGENLLSLAHRNNIDMEGACDASLACTTCHVYIQPEFFSILLPSTDEEEDLLDLAPFLESNSRLGCQVLLTHDMEGMVISLPKVTRNFYVDGHVPKPH